MFTGIRGVFIRVEDLEEATDRYLRLFGGTLTQRHAFEDLGFDTSVITYDNGTYIELISPLDEEGPVARALRSRGEGLHQISFDNEDPRACVEHLRDAEVRLVNDPGRGEPVTQQIFVHPRDVNGVLVQVGNTPFD